MQLDLQLTDGQRFSNKVVLGPAGGEVHGGLGGRRGTGLRFIKVEEGRKGSKLCAFNVDFQDINKIMTVVFHELVETPHLDLRAGTVVVDGTECPGLEVGSVGIGPELRTPL